MRRCARYRPVVAAVLAVLLAPAAGAGAGAVADFYRGKTVTLIVGYSAGGGYDTYARILARHLGKHIPGNPTIVVQNMPGAGSCAPPTISTTSRRRTARPSACSAAAWRWSR